MSGKPNILIGDKVRFNFSYSRRCSERFCDKDNNFTKRILTPSNSKIKEGFIVGVRSVIMDNYTYHCGGEDGPSYASGKYEKVLLISKSLYTELFIVRFKDIIGLLRRI